jgi:hypothetical protein
MPCLLTVTISLTGVGAEQALFRAQPIRLQSQWVVPSRSQRLLLITDEIHRAAGEVDAVKAELKEQRALIDAVNNNKN